MAHAREADACGGCFHEEASPSPSVVTGHRMAFALSETRTVLWDQIQYSGSPRDFAWVLPVAKGAYIEASTNAWFESLEAVTTTQVMAPQLICAPSASSGSGCACGAMSSDAEATAGSSPRGFVEPGGVSVLHEGTVGPYDTVTLESKNPAALVTWLRGHGYGIPPSIAPVIDAYVNEGADFIALRLMPDADVQQMSPVRVITPSGRSILPLRMVAAGVGSNVPITLYVIAEQRYLMRDLAEQTVRWDELTWDWTSSTSNYADLRAGALTADLGKSYLTTFAMPGAFTNFIQRPDGVAATFAPSDNSQGTGGGTQRQNNLVDLYEVQAAIDDKVTFPSCPLVEPRLRLDAPVVACSSAGDGLPMDSPDAAAPDAAVTDAAASDAAASDVADAASAHCEAGANGTIDARDLECGPYGDIAAALIGMHPDRSWITRMEMNLPLEALKADCTLEPHVLQEQVSNWHVAKVHKSPPCQPIDGTKVVDYRPQHGEGRGAASGALAASAFGLLLLRRGGKKRGSRRPPQA
jgi:Uncharacterized protein conserved in bacteria (DUF2330)